LRLSDAAFNFEAVSSEALGRGFRCGFLGMLHMEIINERLKREFNLSIIASQPTVPYKIVKKSGENILIHSPHEMPGDNEIDEIQEPWSRLEIITPQQYMGQIIKILESKRGVYKNTNYLSAEKVILMYELPLHEIIIDLYDKIKSASSGYASMNYELLDFIEGDLIRMDILVAGQVVEAFSRIVHRDKAYEEGKRLVKKLKEVLPRQNFAVSLQAALGSKIIARENISALRKDVTGYLYGGDVTRKKKLLEKQKKGKKKMKELGRVNIPTKVFLDVLKY
jgi:GTP-binding protein LepA